MVMNRSGALIIQDQKGRERERHAVVYGAKLKVKDGAGREAGPAPGGVGPLLVHDPHRGGGQRAASATSSTGRPCTSRWTRTPGCRRSVIMESPDEKKQPRIEITRREGQDARASTCCPPAPTSWSRTATTVSPGDVLAKIPRETRRPRTSRAVCRAWSSCSRRGVQGAGGHHRDRRRREVRRHRQAAPQDLRHRTTTSSASTSCRAAPTSTCRKGSGCKRRRAADGRPHRPARHPARARREGAAAVPGGRDPGGLPPAGREHQRQAHRGDRPADDALGEGGGRGGHASSSSTRWWTSSASCAENER